MRPLILLSFLVLAASCNENKQSTTAKLDIESEIALEQKIGQMIMIGFRGFSINEVSDSIKESIKKGQVGGIVLFDYDVVRKEAKRNIKSPSQLKKLITDIKELSNTKLLIAVDQEGGRVNRLKTKYGFLASVSNEYLGKLDDVDSTRSYAARNAQTLSSMGFNVNFSPDVDLNINPENPVIGKIGRSYGKNAELVIKHASIWIEEHEKKNILSTLKHFPGHGSSDADSHYGITDITKYWSEDELIPFKRLSEKGSVSIMTAHVVNNKLDTFPATLSDKIIKGIIRDQWHFEGLLFSDDLHMGAVNDLYEFDQIIAKSINAGVDILVYGNNLKYDEDIPSKVIASVLRSMDQGVISKERIEASYDRIIKAKSQLQ